MDKGFQRPRVDVSALGIKCAKCGADIKELPFEPKMRDGNSYGEIYCYDCNRERQSKFRRGRRF